jgi:hypothetical protein
MKCKNCGVEYIAWSEEDVFCCWSCVREWDDVIADMRYQQMCDDKLENKWMEEEKCEKQS